LQSASYQVVAEFEAVVVPRDPSSTRKSSSEIADLTTFGLQGQWLTFRFRASSQIDDLRLLPQFSTDLVTWSGSDPVYLDKLALSPALNELSLPPISPNLAYNVPPLLAIENRASAVA
jgi:hypothetical protein